MPKLTGGQRSAVCFPAVVALVAVEHRVVRGLRGFGGRWVRAGRRRGILLIVVVVLEVGFAEAGIVWYACCLTLDELSQEGEFEVVGHDVGWTLDVAALHEELEVGHDLVLELLEPLVELHVVLVGSSVVVLTSTGLAPEGLCELQGVVDFGVEGAIPIGGLFVEQDGEHAGLYAELDEGTAVVVGGGEDALLSLIASGSASGDVAEFWPGEVVGEHDDWDWGKNVARRDMTEWIYRLRNVVAQSSPVTDSR